MMWDYGIGNPVGRYDHGHRGAHVSAVATQAITRAYYGMTDKLFRYHLGCSGGGRMGAMAVLHHPEDYDGAVVSTGFGDGGSMWFPWILQDVVRNPDHWVSPQKLALLESKVVEHCAGPDGLIRDPKACGFDPGTLLCKSGDGPDCLTAGELFTVKRITSPHPTGPGTFSGGFTLAQPTSWSAFLLGNTRPTNKSVENPWAPGAPPPSYTLGQSIMRGLYFDRADYNFVTDMDFNNPADLKKLAEGHPTWGAVSDDISAFKKMGGKLILWAGMAENAVPPATEIQYWNSLNKRDPKTSDFVRLYLAPGVNHCAGGNGPQDTPDRLLEKVIAWREEGRAPDTVLTTAAVPRLAPGPAGAAPVLTPPPRSRTVLLCPYPKMAVFAARKGALAYDADNWKCQ